MTNVKLVVFLIVSNAAQPQTAHFAKLVIIFFNNHHPITFAQTLVQQVVFEF